MTMKAQKNRAEEAVQLRDLDGHSSARVEPEASVSPATGRPSSGSSGSLLAVQRSAMSPQAASRALQLRGRGKGKGKGKSAEQVKARAAEGVSGGGAGLPHLNTIQESFGSHDVSSVKAHVGGKASEASADIGAQAYAMGNSVAFSKSPDLHTAAHEAAHVVQQRAGVQLSGGVGQAGDSYERNADAVADAVVQGKSAESLLGPVAPAAGDKSVQKQADQVQCLGGEDEEEALLGGSVLSDDLKTLDKHYRDLGKQIVDGYRHMDACTAALKAKKITGGVAKTACGLFQAGVSIGMTFAGIPGIVEVGEGGSVALDFGAEAVGGQVGSKAIGAANDAVGGLADDEELNPQSTTLKAVAKHALNEKVGSKKAALKTLASFVPGFAGTMKALEGAHQLTRGEDDWQRMKGVVAGGVEGYLAGMEQICDGIRAAEKEAVKVKTRNKKNPLRKTTRTLAEVMEKYEAKAGPLRDALEHWRAKETMTETLLPSGGRSDL